MKSALRFPSRWAGWWRTLGTTAALSVALGACSTLYGARQGTIEYPGSGAGPGATAVYVVKDKDTVDSLSQRYGVPVQTIVDRNNLKQPYTLQPGQSLQLPGARFVPDNTGGPTNAVASTPPGPVKRENLPPPGQGEAPRSAAHAPPASGQPTPLSPAAGEQSVTVPASLRLARQGQGSGALWCRGRRTEERRHRHPGRDGRRGQSGRWRQGGLCRQRGRPPRQPGPGPASRRLHHGLRQQRSAAGQEGRRGEEGPDHRQGRQLRRRGKPARALRGAARRQQDRRSDVGAATVLTGAARHPERSAAKSKGLCAADPSASLGVMGKIVHTIFPISS